MKVVKLTSDEEQALISERRLTFNAKGERVLVGLTLDDSIWYIELGRAYATLGRQAFKSKEDMDRYWQLHEIHFKAATEISWSENELKTEKPTIN